MYEAGRHYAPHGGLRTFHQKSTCLTRSTLGPDLVKIWSHNPAKREQALETLREAEGAAEAEADPVIDHPVAKVIIEVRKLTDRPPRVESLLMLKTSNITLSLRCTSSFLCSIQLFWSIWIECLHICHMLLLYVVANVIIEHDAHTHYTPHGGARPFHRKSTCLTKLTLGPYVVQIW